MSILIAPQNPYDFYNITNPAIEEFGNKQLSAFWLPSDVDYSNDGKDFLELDAKTQKIVTMTIGFFFSSDGIVFENISINFKPFYFIVYTNF